MNAPYGLEVERSQYRQFRACVSEVVETRSGNVSLRVSRETQAGFIEQVEFLTLTPAEVVALIGELAAKVKIGGGA